MNDAPDAGNESSWSGDRMGYGFGAGGWLMMVGWIVIVVAVVALVVWLLVRAGAGAASQAAAVSRPGGQDAVETLRTRFARGEITKDEYLAAKQVLEDGR